MAPPLPITFGAASARGFGLFSAPAAVLDQYFPYVSLLLPGNGTNGAQNNTFLDSSTNNFTITRNGNTTQGTFTPYGSNWSNYFDGNGDYLTFTKQTTTSSFTCECWFFRGEDVTQYHIVFGGANASVGGADNVQLSVTNTGGVGLVLNASAVISTTGTAVVKNQWNHIAWVRSGTSCAIFVNGSRIATGTSSAALNVDRIAAVGGLTPGSYEARGYISNARITTTAVYDPASTTYTVPTAPLTAITGTYLLTCQSNRFVDNSASPLTITVNGNTSVQRFSPFSPTASYASGTIGGSGYFDGTGDYLTAASNAAFDLSSGAYTAELFVYFTVAPTLTVLFNLAGTGTLGYANLLYQSGTLYWQQRGTGTNQTTYSWSPTTGQWYHIAIGWNGSNSLAIWINGTRVATNTVTPTGAGQNGVALGAASDGYGVGGYINGFRIVKGTDVYGVGNSTITVPTAPLTAITNTSLLTNFTNAGIIDNAMMNDLETVGNAQISTTQSKFGGSSMYFDGTGDYLTRPGSNLFDFGTGDFTIEAWIYPAATQTQFANIICEGSTGNNWYLSFSTSNVITFGTYATVLVTSSSGLSNSTWTHVAVSRSGTSLKMFFNGTQVASATDSTSLGATAALFVGFNNSAHYFNGYIDDLRITKGVARYTANFTAPTAAFPTR